MTTKALAIGSKYHFYVTSHFPDGIDRLVAGLDEEFGGATIGNIWRTAEVIVRSGVDWTGWQKYHGGFRDTYLSSLGGKPEYRHGRWRTEKERKAAMWSHNELAFSLRKQNYIPDEVPMPTFVEGKPAAPSIFRVMAESRGISMDIIHDYFLRSFESQQFLRSNDAYEPATWSALVESNLIVSGDDIPVAAAITDLSMAETRTALAVISEQPHRSLSSNIAVIEQRLSVDESKVRDAISGVRDWRSTYYVLPPETLTWSDFQSLRQQVKGMAVALGDLYVDIVRRKYPVDHMRLTSE